MFLIEIFRELYLNESYLPECNKQTCLCSKLRWLWDSTSFESSSISLHTNRSVSPVLCRLRTSHHTYVLCTTHWKTCYIDLQPSLVCIQTVYLRSWQISDEETLRPSNEIRHHVDLMEVLEQSFAVGFSPDLRPCFLVLDAFPPLTIIRSFQQYFFWMRLFLWVRRQSLSWVPGLG